MAIPNAKLATRAGMKFSAKSRAENTPNQMELSANDGGLCSMGKYHYAGSPLQRRFTSTPAADAKKATYSRTLPKKSTYSTGLPASLRSGIQALSGLNLDCVKVHYNSREPSQINADAYAQGNDIHLSSEHEEHLPHEAWHIVQQRERRVPTTSQINGQSLNVDSTLEREADVMGAAAASLGTEKSDRAVIQPPSAPTPSNAPIQGHFTDLRKRSPFGALKASVADIDLIKLYLTREAPALLEAFVKQASDGTNHGTLQDWLKSNGLPLLQQIEFPQTRNIPPSWIVSTNTPNDDGPPILLNPEHIDSPASSQEQDIALESAPKSTDLVIDLTRDQLAYHRGGVIPVDEATRSEVRAAALLTNEYIDRSPRPLVGRGTQPIKKQTDALRKRARDHDTAQSSNRTFSHRPDTFWTQQSYSPMGWHPVGKHTNTLDGDYQKLTERSGQELTGLITKEKRGYTRPTFDAYHSSRARRKNADALLKNVASASFEELKAIHQQAKELAVTHKAKILWKELGITLNYVDYVIAEGLSGELAKRVSVSFETGFDQTPKTTSEVGRLLDAIAQRLKILW